MPHPDKVFDALLLLLRAGLWGQLPSQELRAAESGRPTLFPLTAEEWAQLYREACEQTVVGIVWQGVSQLPQELMPPHATTMRWVAHVDAIERHNAAMDKALESLLSLYDSRGIEPVVLKGHTVAALYPSPELRQSGDIDLYFHDANSRKQAEQLVRDKGCSISCGADGSTHFSWHGATIEHHSEIFDLQHPRSAKIVEHTMQGIENLFLSLQVNNNLVVKALAPRPNMLLLVTHTLKHAMGRGVGLRQLCDAAMAYKAYGAAHDAAAQREFYAALGLERWCALLHSFLVQWLGMPRTALPWETPTHDTAPLMHIVRRGGNFGQHATTSKNNGAATRKIETAFSFIRNIGFCAKYAPGEALYTFWQLLKGQCKQQ